MLNFLKKHWLITTVVIVVIILVIRYYMRRPQISVETVDWLNGAVKYTMKAGSASTTNTITFTGTGAEQKTDKTYDLISSAKDGIITLTIMKDGKAVKTTTINSATKQITEA